MWTWTVLTVGSAHAGAFDAFYTNDSAAYVHGTLVECDRWAGAGTPDIALTQCQFDVHMLFGATADVPESLLTAWKTEGFTSEGTYRAVMDTPLIQEGNQHILLLNYSQQDQRWWIVDSIIRVDADEVGDFPVRRDGRITYDPARGWRGTLERVQFIPDASGMKVAGVQHTVMMSGDELLEGGICDWDCEVDKLVESLPVAPLDPGRLHISRWDTGLTDTSDTGDEQ